MRIDQLSTIEIVDLINAEDRMVAEAVGEERAAIARAVDMVVDCFRNGGRLFYVGAGTSGRLGVLDAAEMPPTYGTDPEMVQGIIAGGYAALVRAQEGAEDNPDDGAAAPRRAARQRACAAGAGGGGGGAAAGAGPARPARRPPAPPRPAPRPAPAPRPRPLPPPPPPQPPVPKRTS